MCNIKVPGLLLRNEENPVSEESWFYVSYHEHLSQAFVSLFSRWRHEAKKAITKLPDKLTQGDFEIKNIKLLPWRYLLIEALNYDTDFWFLTF